MYNNNNKTGSCKSSEAAIIGCLMSEPKDVENVAAIVNGSMFSDRDIGKILNEVINQHRSQPGHVDELTVHAELERNRVSGPEITSDFIANLMWTQEPSENVIEYAKAVKASYRDRKIKSASRDIHEAGNDSEVSKTELVSMMRKAADDFDNSSSTEGFETAKIPSVLDLYQRERLKLDYVIEGLVSGTVGILAGYGAVGKGMFSLALAIDVALGADQNGMGQITGIRSASGLSRTAFLTLEDTTESMIERVQRLADVVVERNLRGSAKDGIELFTKIDKQVHIASFFGRKNCTFLIQEGKTFVRNEPFINYVKTKFKGYRLIVLDTFRKLAAGVDENDSAAASLVLQICDEIAAATGAAVICVHHLGKPSGASKERDFFPSIFSIRGSSAIVMDARWAAVYGVPSSSMCSDLGTEELVNRRVLDIAKVNNGVAGRVFFENVKGVPVAIKDEFVNKMNHNSHITTVKIKERIPATKGSISINHPDIMKMEW